MIRQEKCSSGCMVKSNQWHLLGKFTESLQSLTNQNSLIEKKYLNSKLRTQGFKMRAMFSYHMNAKTLKPNVSFTCASTEVKTEMKNGSQIR